MRAATRAAASSGRPQERARSAASGGSSSSSSWALRSRPSRRSRAMSTRLVCRRTNRTLLLRLRCALDSGVGGDGGEQRGDGEPFGLCDVGGEHGEGAPGGGKRSVGVEPAVEQLEVVRGDEERTDDHEGHEHEARAGDTRGPDGDGADERGGGGHGEHRGRDRGPQGSAVQLVEGVRGDPHGEEEGEQGGDETLGVEVWCQGGADGHVGEVPRGVRRVQERPPLACPARGSVEGGAMVSHRCGAPTSPTLRRGS